LSSQHLLGHKALEGKPDLSLHTLIHFLDRFVYRNPKAGTSALRGTSVMQPLAGSDRGDLLVSARPTTRLQTPVNDESFWKKQAGDVAAEDAFFHEYFSRIGKEKKPSRKDNGEARKEHGSESDEEGEEEIWKALVRSKGDVEPDEDSDVDLDMDDMESDEEGEGEEGKSGELDEADEADDIDDDEDVLDGEDLGLDDSDDPWADSDWDLLSDADVAGGEVVEAEEGTTGSNKDERKKKRRKLKQLPTFASAEDYAAMLDDDDGEDLG
jgi:ribosome biogenesis protein MAK21